MKILVLLSLVATVIAIHDKYIDVPTYDGYKVFRVFPTHHKALRMLKHLHIGNEFDFWTEPREDQPTDIMAPANRVADLQRWLREHGIPHEVMIQNVQELIEKEKIPAANYSLPRNSKYAFTWDRYHRIDAMHAFIDALGTNYPKLVTVQNIGSSYEGRPLKLAKLSTGGSNKPGIFIDGGIHSREWISASTVAYILHELVENQAKHANVLEKADWYIMPNINPDGYEFSHTNARMWRKTRSDHQSFWGCRGVDANRNWDFHWGVSGVSFDKCSDIYCGPHGFSEVETKSISNFLLENKGKIHLYISFHSFSQLWLTPWGYTQQYPSDYRELESLAITGVRALTAVHGTRYGVGTSSNVLYPAAGGSDDWTKAVGGVKYTYTIELRDTGHHGFILPPEQIIPTGEETLAGVKATAEKIIKLHSVN